MSGLAVVFGLQAVINMGVNVSLLPAKGMTLAVHLLWRFVAHRHGLRHGTGAGVRTPAPPRAELPQPIACDSVSVRSWRRAVHSAASGSRWSSAAGGTGGHLFPAQALAEELVRRGYVIHLMTDERVRDYGAQVSGPRDLTISRRRRCRCPSRWLLPLQAVSGCARGYRHARRIILRDLQPVALVGFGGYPSFPPVLAASRLKCHTVIHEQNAVMGRANRALLACVDAVASSFPTLGQPDPALDAQSCA